MPPGIRTCPSCTRTLGEGESLVVLVGQKKPANPKLRPPEVEVHVCEACKKSFLGVLFLLHEAAPHLQAIVWPEDDPRRSNSGGRRP